MSTGFRLFLLTLASFGAIYAYRLRSPELSHWLRAQAPSLATAAADDSIASPVDEVLDPNASLARLLWESPKRIERPVRSPREEIQPAVYQDSPSSVLSEEEGLEAADLAAPLEDGADGEVIDSEVSDGGETPADDARAEPEGREAEGSEQAAEVEPALEVGYVEVDYTVGPGDNLWKIAAQRLGSGSRFGEIREWNIEFFRGRSTDVLPVGTVLKLRLPAAAEKLKETAQDADSSVEADSAREPSNSLRKPIRPAKVPTTKAKQVAGR